MPKTSGCSGVWDFGFSPLVLVSDFGLRISDLTLRGRPAGQPEFARGRCGPAIPVPAPTLPGATAPCGGLAAAPWPALGGPAVAARGPPGPTPRVLSESRAARPGGVASRVLRGLRGGPLPGRARVVRALFGPSDRANVVAPGRRATSACPSGPFTCGGPSARSRPGASWAPGARRRKSTDRKWACGGSLGCEPLARRVASAPEPSRRQRGHYPKKGS